MGSLQARAVVCTLTASPGDSSTALNARQVLDDPGELDVETGLVRLAWRTGDSLGLLRANPSPAPPSSE
jgi:hypothetical protein